MFKDNLTKIEISGKEYPIKCDMVVLERIQKEYGDIRKYENSILGLVPYYDEDGNRDESRDENTIPDIETVCKSLSWMIEEGVEISGQELEIPDEKALMRQDDFSPTELALEVWKEFSKSFLSKRKQEKTKTKK